MDHISIIGGGVLSMISAIAISKVGFNVSLIEETSNKQELSEDETRTLAITISSKEFLSKINIWEEHLAQYATNIKDIYVVDNMSNNMIHFNHKLIPYQEQIGFMIKYQDIYQTLLSYIQGNRSIERIKAKYIQTSHDTTTNSSKISIDNKMDILSKYTLINTGPKSNIHKKYFSELLTKNYNQMALTFLVQHTKPHQGTAVEHFVQSSIFAILPMKNPHLSSVVWSVNSDYGKFLKNLDKEIFTTIIQDKFGEFLGEIKVDSKINSTNLSGYLCKNYINKKFLAIGSSLHIIHPLAGQGLNLSLKDVEIIQDILLSSQHDSEKQINNFYKQRYYDNLNMFYITNYINKIFANNSKLLFGTRQILFHLIEKSSYLKSCIMKYAVGYR